MALRNAGTHQRQHARLDRGPFVEGRNLVAGVVLGAALEDLVLVLPMTWDGVR